MSVKFKKSRTVVHGSAPEKNRGVADASAAVTPPQMTCLEPDVHVHLGDWIAFYLWIGCFLLLTAMNWYDLFCALINW